MELYIVRHGETGYNKMELLQGKTDIPLNEIGRKQALETKKNLEHISFDIVMSSPLKRAVETASLIAPNHIIKIDERLIERNLGEYEGKPKRIYNQDLYHDYFKNCTEHGVEGIQHLIFRIQTFLEELKKSYPNSVVLLVTHGAYINALRYCFEEIPQDGILKRIGLKNGEFIKYNL